jgi:aspartate/methionine/tyrosine aminotransferase
MKEIYNRRREFMLKRLKEMGLGVAVESTGAFYILANAQHYSSQTGTVHDFSKKRS